MAYRMFRVFKTVTSCIQNPNVQNNAIVTHLLPSQFLLLQNVRMASNFFTRRSATDLWKSVTSISNPGKRRGRGKGLPRIRNLNKGKKIGYGKVPIVFPGLNSPIVQGAVLVKQRRLAEDEVKGYTESLPHSLTRKRLKIHPLNRGWSGGIAGGRRIGPPDPVNNDTFDGFETWILFSKYASIMTGNLGRTKCIRCMVITGNRNGLAGFATISAREVKSAMTTAKNRAGQRLIHIERYNDHTVLHDFYTQFGSTKIFVEQKYKGYGLKCHRVIRACCEALGITDLYAKVEGSNNIDSIVKAFFIGLLQQKTHEELANEKRLHLVEMKKENNYFPTVLASPTRVRDNTEIPSNEILDFKQYVMDGRIRLKKKPREPFYTKLPSWLSHLRKQERHRDQDEVAIRLRAEFGEIRSFLAENYPEAKASKWRKSKKTEEENTEVE